MPPRCISPRYTRFRRALALALVLALVPPSTAQPLESPESPEMRSAVDVGGLEARSAALVLSGQQGGDLAASVLVVPFPGPDPETVRLVLVVDLAASSLLAPKMELASPEPASPEPAPAEPAPEPVPPGSEAPLVTEVHAYALGPDDTLVAHSTQAFALEPGELAGKAGVKAGVKYLGVLEVPPGEWSVRLLVRQRGNGRMALRSLPVTAPSFAPKETSEGLGPVLLPPWFADPPERWILVRGGGGDDGASVPFPLDLRAAGDLVAGEEGAGGGWLVPSTRPVIEPGGRAFYLLGRGLEAEGDRPARPWTVRAYESGTEPPEAEPPEAEPPEAEPPQDTAFPRVTRLGAFAPVSGWVLYEAELDPDPLVAGSGTLWITAPSGARASLPAVVIPPRMARAETPAGSVGDTRLWTDFLDPGTSLPGAAGEPVPVAPRTTEAAEITDEELAHFQAAYLDALGHLARGDRPGTLAAVVQVERSGLARGTAAETLARGQLQVAFDVSGGSVDRLLPLIQLHRELYREHREQGRPSLAAHARRVTLGLVELYARHSEDRDRGRIAAAALVGLAAELLEYGNTLETLSVLDLALEHDPEHPAALLTLATLYELLGDYPHTVTLLRKLEKVTSESDAAGAEARLRLGINLARIGSRKAAAEYLGASLAPDRPRWIRAVAYEELAVLRVDQGEPAAAAALLAEALDRMPGQQRFYIQLAAIHESLGDPAAARAVLDRLEERVRRRPGRDRDSPRLRYSQWPEEALEASRRRFEKAATSRMTALAEALADFTARGG